MDTTADMIEHLLGQNGIAKVTLVTTKWTKNPSRKTARYEELRERELREDHWDWQIRCNSKMERYDDSLGSALNIVHDLTVRSRPVRLGSERCRPSAKRAAEEPTETLEYEGTLRPERTKASDTQSGMSDRIWFACGWAFGS